MTRLRFTLVGAEAERYAAVPMVSLRLRLTETTGEPVHAVVLRCQVMIEPQKRQYDAAERARLEGVFGPPGQWGESLRPMLWANVATTVSGFTGETTVDLPVALTYDFEVAGAPYLERLGGGDIPLLCLFSGTTFTKGERGLAAEPVSWTEESRFELPVATYRAAMEAHFPNSAWVRMHRDTLEGLLRFRARHALPSWDDVFERLLKEAGEER